MFRKDFGIIGACVLLNFCFSESCSSTPFWTSTTDVIRFSQDAADGKIPALQAAPSPAIYLKAVIDETVSKKSDILLPGGLTIEHAEWQKAKLVEIIWTANKCFQDISFSKLCLDTLTTILSSPGTNYQLAKYLLMSQCIVWDESAKSFEKAAEADKDLIAEAIWKLRVATNGDIPKSKELLQSLKTSGKFEELLGDWTV